MNPPDVENDELDSRLYGKRVRLRSIRESDVDVLATLGAAEPDSHRWLVQFIVAARDDGRPLGHVFAYDHDHLSRCVSFAIDTIPQVRGRGVGLEGAILFVNYLFDHWPFEVVIGAASQRNVAQYRSAVGRWFECFGTLREHEFVEGQYVDTHILGGRRDQWRDWWNRRRRMTRSDIQAALATDDT